MRPSEYGQWLYDGTADDGEVGQAVCTALLLKQDRAEAKDGYKVRYRARHRRVEAKQNEAGLSWVRSAAPACLQACLLQVWSALACRYSYAERAPYSLPQAHCHRHTSSVLRVLLTLALIKPDTSDVEADPDLRDDHTGAAINRDKSTCIQYIHPLDILEALHVHGIFQLQTRHALMSCSNDTTLTTSTSTQRAASKPALAWSSSRPQPHAATKAAPDSVCKRVESWQLWLVSVD